MTQKLVDSFRGLAESAIAGAPKVVMAIVMLIVALIVAKVIEKVLRLILVRIKFDTLIGKAGIDKALQGIGLKKELSRLLPRLVYFLVLFVMARVIADSLGIAAISDALNSFFAYLPNLVSAVLLVIVGSTIGPVAGDAVAGAAESAGLDFGKALGRIVSAVILFVVGLMALAQLKIDTDIVRLVTGLGMAGFALAFGLSFGLGSRELTRNILAGFYAKKVLRVGEPVEIAGQQGVLRAVTPTHTLIDSDDRTVTIANGKFFEEVTRQ